MPAIVKMTSKRQITVLSAKSAAHPWQGALRAYAELKDTHDMTAIRKTIACKQAGRE